MTVFLDIGAHRGMTVEAALDYGFDRVFAFEPMPREFAELEDAYGTDPRVTLCNFGLSDATGARTMYGTNDRFEASIHRTSWVAEDAPSTECEFVNATDWFRANLPEGTQAVVKMNCEASEADIFDSLIASKEIWKIAAVTICWDVRLVPGMEHREGRVRRGFSRIGFNGRWHMLAACKGPTHKARVWEWLDGLRPADWLPAELTADEREPLLAVSRHGV